MIAYEMLMNLEEKRISFCKYSNGVLNEYLCEKYLKKDKRLNLSISYFEQTASHKRR